MNILIDTHIAIWSLYNDKKLSESSFGLLRDLRNNIYVSLVSAWEIEIKNSLGKLDVPSDSFIRDCEAMGFCLLPVKKEHILALKTLPYLDNGHKDPFDRLLIAQAESEGFSFLSEDSKILDYDCSCILRG